MRTINIKKIVSGDVDHIVNQVTEALKKEGFGVLTRIDLDAKVKEKLGKDMRLVIILGACNPQLAFEAYQKNPDVTGLLPCNAVIRETGNNEISVEIAKPSALMEMLNDPVLIEMAREADNKLQNVLNSL